MNIQIISYLQIFSILLKLTNGNNQHALLTSYCSEEQNYASKIDYLNSRELLLATLASKSKTEAFYNFTTNIAGYKINGIFYCTHRFEKPICHECIKIAAVQISQSCPSSSEAIVWYSDCMLRYSNRNISSFNDVSVSYSIVVGSKRFSKFSEELSSTLISLIEMAYDSFREIEWTSESYISAMLTVPFTRFMGVNCYADCTPDIFPSECFQCLQAALGRLGFDGSESGMVLLPSCRLKYNFIDFPPYSILGISNNISVASFDIIAKNYYYGVLY